MDCESAQRPHRVTAVFRRTLVRHCAQGYLGTTGRAAVSAWGGPRRVAVVGQYSNRGRKRPLNGGGLAVMLRVGNIVP
jgi:hypothetical protein